MPKSKNSKKGNSNFIGIVFIAIIGLVVGFLAITDVNPSLLLSLQHHEAKQAGNFIIPTLEPTETPTDTPTPIPQVYQPPADPIITCNSTYPKCLGQSIQIKQSECPNITCCGFKNGTWRAELNSQCTIDQNNDTGGTQQTNTQPTQQNTYVPTNYYPCTLYYPALHSYQTYNSLYTSKDQCDSAQASLNQGSTTTQNSAPTSIPQPIDATAYNNCVSSAKANTSQQIQQCYVLYGDMSSAGPGCAQIRQQEGQQAVYNCNVYPH